MNPLIVTLLVILGVGLLLVFALVGIYNRLVLARNRFKNAFAQIDVQLKRRYDLIPNLVETVKGYMSSRARDARRSHQGPQRRDRRPSSKLPPNPGRPSGHEGAHRAEGRADRHAGPAVCPVRGYPDLKANQNMLALQEELTSTENKIGFARQAFNDSVMAYNNRREVFPSVMVAGIFGFTQAALARELQRKSAKHPRCHSSDLEPRTISASPALRFHTSRGALTMATDFFQQQDAARGKTGRLVVYFVLGILILVALVYGLLLVFVHYGGGGALSWWQPGLLGVVAAGVGILVGGTSLFKVSQLSSGGQAVALMMDAVEIPVRPPTRGRSGCSTSSRRWPSPRECRCLPSIFWMSRASTPSRPAMLRATPWSPSPRAALIT